MIYIILLIIIIYLINSNNKLSEEISKLQEELSKVYSFCPHCGKSLKKQTSPNPYIIQAPKSEAIPHTTFKQDIPVPEVINHKPLTDKEVKNSFILIVGSILIILSAIVFLTSTWNITHNFFKTIIIILMLGVFLVASYLADKVFHLKQTSRAFYYIALAYLPILLLSIALFQLFGKYLSIYGLGRYLYLAISSALVAGVYYYHATTKKSSILIFFSVVFSLLGIIFLTLHFTNNITIILIMLLGYNMAFMISYLYNKIYYNKDFHLKVITILTPTLAILFLYYLLSLYLSGITLTTVILEGILFINAYIFTIKIINKPTFYQYLYPIFTIVILYTLSWVIGSIFLVRQLCVLLAFALIYLYDLKKSSQIQLTSYFTIVGSFLLLYLATIFEVDIFQALGINCYLLWLIFTIFSFLSYLFTTKAKSLQAYLFTSSMVITTIYFVWTFHLNEVWIGYLLIGLLVSSLSISLLNNNLKKAFSWVGHISFWSISLSYLKSDFSFFLLFLYSLYLIIACIESLQKRCEFLKFISYIYLNIAMNTLFQFFQIEALYVLPLTTLLITVLDMKDKQFQSKWNNIYITAQYILSYLLLATTDCNIFPFTLALALGGIHIFYGMYHKLNKNYFYIPAMAIIPFIYTSQFLSFNSFNYMYIISFLLIFSMIYLIYSKKSNFYISLSYIYTFFHIVCLEEIKYISILLLIIETGLCFLIKEDKIKDGFKFLLYINLFILYQYIITDLHLNHFTFLTIGSCFILLLLSTRTIFHKYTNTYKIWEYIIGICIQFIAMMNYYHELDGILYVLFLAILVIISYLYKYGPCFLVSLLFILLNIFLLTKTFWLSIPWWLYILLIGSMLIVFAIYNEVKLKKENTLKNKVVKLKDDLNL